LAQRVLVVEDEPNIADVVKLYLEEMDYSVEVCGDGCAALKRLREMPQPDVILLDLLMPLCSGREVLAEVRADPRLASTPVILVTGFSPDTRIFPPKGTYQACLTKPFGLDTLCNTIARSVVQVASD